MNTLKLDPDTTSSLGECETGETKTLSVTGVVTKAPDGSLSLAVSEVKPYEMEDDEVAEGEEIPMAPAVKEMANKRTKGPTRA